MFIFTSNALPLGVKFITKIRKMMFMTVIRPIVFFILVFVFFSSNAYSALCRHPSLVNGGGYSASCGPLIYPCLYGITNIDVVGNEVAPGIFGPGPIRFNVSTVPGTNAIYLVNWLDPMSKGAVNKKYSSDGHFDYWTRIGTPLNINAGWEGTFTIKVYARTNFHYEGSVCGYQAYQAHNLLIREVKVKVGKAPPIIPPTISPVIQLLLDENK